MEYGWASSFVFSILGALDRLIYTLVSTVLNGIYNIAGTEIFTGDSITKIFNRIYVILGIFMLFKLAFSLLTSIINPDKFTDKQNGMSKIIVRVVITLSLLLMVPSIFDAAYHVQGNVLKALPQIVIGPNESYADSSAGETIALSVYKAFVKKNEECTGPSSDLLSLKEIPNYVSEECPHSTEDGKKIFTYDYTFIISTIIGGIMIVLLVLISVDVGIRMIKMSILQIIAPIPIMTYIDPKSEKDGSFGNWIKECISTYISLFLQLGVIYIIIHLITSIIDDPASIIKFPAGIGTLAETWVIIFIVIGGFFFMRQAPKFLLKVLGIKDGTGLGIGLNAGLAGLGAVTGGAGLLGAAKAVTQSLDEGATANTDGKSAFGTGGLRKGRDIAAQFKTGDPKAKAKATTEKINDAIMSRKAASLGFTKDTVGKAKDAKFAAADAASNAQSLRSRFQNANGDLSKMSDEDIETLRKFGASNIDKYGDMTNEQLVDAYVNAKNTESNKASSYYDKATKLANIYGVKTDDDLYDEFNPKYHSKKRVIHNALDDIKTTRKNNIANDAIDENRNDRIANRDDYKNNRGFNPDRYNPKAGNNRK